MVYQGIPFHNINFFHDSPTPLLVYPGLKITGFASQIANQNQPIANQNKISVAKFLRFNVHMSPQAHDKLKVAKCESVQAKSLGKYTDMLKSSEVSPDICLVNF